VRQRRLQILTRHHMAVQLPDRLLAHTAAKVLMVLNQKARLSQVTAVLMELKKLPPLGINRHMVRQRLSRRQEERNVVMEVQKQPDMEDPGVRSPSLRHLLVHLLPDDSVTESVHRNLLPRARRSRKEDSAERTVPTAVLDTIGSILGIEMIVTAL